MERLVQMASTRTTVNVRQVTMAIAVKKVLIAILNTVLVVLFHISINTIMLTVKILRTAILILQIHNHTTIYNYQIYIWRDIQ